VPLSAAGELGLAGLSYLQIAEPWPSITQLWPAGQLTLNVTQALVSQRGPL
jgi:hypothetical protein